MAKLEPEGDHYILTNETGASITISDQDLLTLSQSAQRLKDHVLAKYSRGGGATAVPVTEVAQVAVNTDLHQTHLQLGMMDPAGVLTWFALPLDVAKELVGRLPVRVAELEQSAAGRREH
jgi:hypothetical protein